MCLRTIPRRLLPLSGSICHPFKLFVSPFAVAFPDGALLSHQETRWDFGLAVRTEKEGAAQARAEPPARAAGLWAAPTEQCQPLSTANPNRITVGSCQGQLRAGAPKPGSTESCPGTRTGT